MTIPDAEETEEKQQKHRKMFVSVHSCSRGGSTGVLFKKTIKSCISNYAGLPKELLLISYVAFTQDYNLHT